MRAPVRTRRRSIHDEDAEAAQRGPPPPPLPFWSESGGLDLASSRLLPGGHAIELRFRGGQVYQIELGCLGFAGPGLLATPAAAGGAVVLALSTGGLVEVATSRLLAAAEPAYREALARAAEVPRSVGALIRARRRAAGFTAIRVAAAAGMARSNYARLEASRHHPRVDTLRRVASALGIGLEDLLDQGG